MLQPILQSLVIHDEKKWVKGAWREQETDRGRQAQKEIMLMVRDETKTVLKKAQRNTKKC